MDQAGNARGGASLYALYENDPAFIHEKRRRHGSIRQARYAPSLGLAAPGRAARAQVDQSFAVSSGWTSYLSVMTGDLFELNTAYPLVTLRADRTGASTTDSFQLYAIRTGATTYWLGIKAINTTPATTSSETFAISANTDYHLALRWSGTVLSITDNTTTKTITPGGTFTGPYYIDICGSKFTSVKPKANAPVIANFSFDTSYAALVPQDLSARNPSLDYYWRLDGQEAGNIISADTGSAYLLGFPAAPQLVDSALQFSSESGALQIEHSTDFDRFWQTATRSVGQESMTFHLSGTRGPESGRAVVLLDYGDLIKVEILATNYVRLTYNGTAVTDATTQITSGTAFSIFAGRNGSSLALQVSTTLNTGTAPAVPYLDFSRIQNIYVGADEDPEADTHFLGNLTTFALWPFATRKDAGADLATFYFDLTGDQIEDSSLNAVPAVVLEHTNESGAPVFKPGPIDDAQHVSVEGGAVIGNSGPLDFDNSLTKRMDTDTASLRVGYRSFVSSGNRAHVVDHRLSRTRPLGLPKPGADVTVQAVGTGALDGVYAYGYQFESADGTVGPVKRLNPVAATDGARVILGSSDGNENEIGTELDESYGTNYLDSDIPAAGDRFEAAWDGAPTAGTYTTEVRARLRDVTEDDLREKVHHRAVTAADGVYTADTLYFSTDIPTHSFNINGNWTVQTVFEYHKPKDAGNPMVGFGLWGVGKTERLTGGTTFPSYNQDFVAYFLDGEADAADLVSAYYTTTEGKGAHYGDGTSPKLVVGWPRQERRESWYSTGRRMALNYAILTFSDDPDWTEGSTYDIIFKRAGQGIEVWYRNLTAGDTAYTQLTPNNMNALPSRTSGSGKTVPAKSAYTGSDFFIGYSPKTDARDFHFGTAMDYHLADVPFITSTGQVNEEDYSDLISWPNYPTSGATNNNLVKPAPGGTTGWKPMHFRVWNRAMSTVDMERHSVYRSAALDGEPLNHGIFIDLGCVLEVETTNTDKLTDKASGMIWFAKNEQGAGASRSPSAETLAFASPTTSDLVCPRYPLAMFGTVGAAFAAADLKLFVSPLGDGSYTLQAASNGAFNLRRKIWATLTADPLTTKLLGDFQTFVSDFDQFKWHSFGLVFKASGGDRLIGADSWAINGNTIFKSTIGGTSSETVTAAHFTDAAGWIKLAGFQDATEPSWPVDISEFRVWKTGFGPDVERGTNFKYLLGRVSENELTNLLTYFKFQPDDEAAGTIEDYGTLDNPADENGNATIVDTRTTAGGSNPAPKTAFPGAPFEDVTGIRVCRSAVIPINDPDDDTEVQTALDAARAVPLYRLASIPVGSTHYVDAAPDEALGFEIPFDSGQVPQQVTSLFVWQGHLGLTTGDYDLWLSEGGPFGWETFPEHLRHRVPVTTGGSAAVAAVEAGGLLYVFGREWTSIVAGSPTAPDFTTIGAGCGAYAPRCATVYANMAFAYNGTLWMITGGEPVNFGLEVQDLLPAAANARLCTSSSLASLYLIDETTGVALRYHFPTRRWSVEERDAVACGDLDTSVDAWVTRHGAWAQGSTSVYSDDVNAGTIGSRTGTASGNTVTVSSGVADIPLGTRCTIQNSDGTAITARITAITGSPSQITFDDLTGASGSVTLYLGAGSTGMLIDPGILDLRNEDAKIAARNLVHVLQGTGWEIGMLATAQPGDPADRDSVVYTAVDTTDEKIGTGSLMGRFQRWTLRNLIPEACRVTYFEVTV